MPNRYKEFKHLNLPAIEKDMLEQWEQEQAFFEKRNAPGRCTPFCVL